MRQWVRGVCVATFWLWGGAGWAQQAWVQIEAQPTESEARARAEFGDNVPMTEHPNIRSAYACLTSSSMAVDLARRFDALLHVLHLTTAIEMPLFSRAPRWMSVLPLSGACMIEA